MNRYPHWQSTVYYDVSACQSTWDPSNIGGAVSSKGIGKMSSAIEFYFVIRREITSLSSFSWSKGILLTTMSYQRKHHIQILNTYCIIGLHVMTCHFKTIVSKVVHTNNDTVRHTIEPDVSGSKTLLTFCFLCLPREMVNIEDRWTWLLELKGTFGKDMDCTVLLAIYFPDNRI